MKVYLIVLALAVSTNVLGARFETESEFRQCGEDHIAIEERLEKLTTMNERNKDMSDELEIAEGMLSIQRSVVRSLPEGSSARNEAARKFNADNAILKAHRQNLNVRIDRVDELAGEYNDMIADYKVNCKKTVNTNSEMWDNVCVRTNTYRRFCRGFSGD